MHHTLLLGPKSPRADIEITYALTFTVTNQAFDYGGGFAFPASKEDFEWTRRFVRSVEKLLEQRKLEPVKPIVGKGGLAGVLEGIDLYRREKVSGQKLSYKIA